MTIKTLLIISVFSFCVLQAFNNLFSNEMPKLEKYELKNRKPANSNIQWVTGPLKDANIKIQEIIDNSNQQDTIITLCGDLEFSNTVYLKSNIEIIGCTNDEFQRENKITAEASSTFKSFFSKAYSEINLQNVTINNLIADGSRGSDYRKSVWNFININPHSEAGKLNTINNLVIKRNSISKFYQTAILLYKSKYNVNNIEFYNIEIENNFISDIYVSMGIFINDGIERPLSTYDIPNKNINILGNTIHRIGTKSLEADSAQNIAGFGVLVVGCRDVNIKANKVKWFKEEALRVNESAVVYVSHNTIEDSLTIDDYPGGIKLNRVTNASIWSNSVNRTEKSGIEILGGNIITIYNNYLAYNKNHAIRVSDNHKANIPDFITQNLTIKPNAYQSNTGEKIAFVGELSKESVRLKRSIRVE